MEDCPIIHRLQLLQRRLQDMANNLGNLTDPEILKVSEEADRLIVQLQKMYMEKAFERQKGAQSLFSDAQPAEELGQKASALFLKHS